MAKSKPADPVGDMLSTPVPRIPVIPTEDFVSTGCTLMDLAFSGRVRCGVPKGNYVRWVGASGSCKTWLSLCLFAEAARNPSFKKHRFILDNAENGALMDLEQYFGKGVRERLESPRVQKKTKRPVYSETVKQFYINAYQTCLAGPCIYVLDSMDALNDEADDAQFGAEVKLYETGEGKVPGSYGMQKAKTNAKNINREVQVLREHGSILVVISQTRDKIGGMYPGQQTSGGGRTLKFFAHLEPWLSVGTPLKKKYLGKDRQVGDTIKVDLQKNRVSGWEGKFEFDFVKGYGVDDLGSMVKYLIEENHWEGAVDRGGLVTELHAPEFEFNGTGDELIQVIQQEGEEWELAKLTSEVWQSIIDGARPERKPRYS